MQQGVSYLIIIIIHPDNLVFYEFSFGDSVERGREDGNAYYAFVILIIFYNDCSYVNSHNLSFYLGDNLPVFSQCRTATKKAGGSVKRQGHNKKRKGKRYGPKVDQGISFIYINSCNFGRL